MYVIVTTYYGKCSHVYHISQELRHITIKLIDSNFMFMDKKICIYKISLII